LRVRRAETEGTRLGRHFHTCPDGSLASTPASFCMTPWRGALAAACLHACGTLLGRSNPAIPTEGAGRFVGSWRSRRSWAMVAADLAIGPGRWGPGVRSRGSLDPDSAIYFRPPFFRGSGVRQAAAFTSIWHTHGKGLAGLRARAPARPSMVAFKGQQRWSVGADCFEYGPSLRRSSGFALPRKNPSHHGAWLRSGLSQTALWRDRLGDE